MSYSISAQAGTKAAALAILATKMADVVAQQPIHEADKDKALAVATSFAELMQEPPEGKEFVIGLNGSVTTVDGVLSNVNVACSAYHVVKPS